MNISVPLWLGLTLLLGLPMLGALALFGWIIWIWTDGGRNTMGR